MNFLKKIQFLRGKRISKIHKVDDRTAKKYKEVGGGTLNKRYPGLNRESFQQHEPCLERQQKAGSSFKQCNNKTSQAMEGHTFNLSTREAEEGGFLRSRPA